jgi:hypothetical protein
MSKRQTTVYAIGHGRCLMGVPSKTTSPEIIGALAHSKRGFSLPTWAQLIAAAPRAYGRDVEIFGQQEPADCLYKVVNGAVRSFSVLRDGRRHIAGFYLAGDFFGLEANSRHALSAEAICNSKILVTSAVRWQFWLSAKRTSHAV